MSFLWANNFDGGPDATTITAVNSGQVPGNTPFDIAQFSANATLKYDSSLATRPTAEYVMKTQIGGTTGYGRVCWNTFGSVSQLYYRFYACYPTLPTNATQGMVIYFAGVSGEDATVTVDCPTAATLSVRSSIGLGARTPFATTTNVMVAGEWCRIEGRMQFSTTTGNGELRIFLGNDVDADLPTESVAFTSANLVDTTCDTVFFGYVLANGANFNPLYISGLAISDLDWIGPAPFRQKSSPGILTNATAIHSDVW